MQKRAFKIFVLIEENAGKSQSFLPQEKQKPSFELPLSLQYIPKDKQNDWSTKNYDCISTLLNGMIYIEMLFKKFENIINHKE